MIEWTLSVIPIKSLKPHPKNPRQINKEQQHRLSANMDKFGLIDKPIVNRDFTIIGGHQRIAIYKKKKAKTIECWIPERALDEAEIDELCISLNLHQGQWDYDIMADQWDPLDLLKYGFTESQLLGITEDDIESIESEEKASKKKNKCCPNCGHEFL